MLIPIFSLNSYVFFPYVHGKHLPFLQRTQEPKSRPGFYWFLVWTGSSSFLFYFYTPAHCQVVSVAEPAGSQSWALPRRLRERGVPCPDLLHAPNSSFLMCPFLPSSWACPCPPRLRSALPSAGPRPVSPGGAFVDSSPLVCRPCRARATPDNSMSKEMQ